MTENVRNRDWSSKHTRLRYQSVLSATLFALICTQSITAFKVPGVFEFGSSPPYYIIWSGAFVFFIFSLVSFWVQSRIEENTLLITGADPSELVSPFIADLGGKLFCEPPVFSMEDGSNLKNAFDHDFAERSEYTEAFQVSLFVDHALLWVDGAKVQMHLVDANLQASFPELLVLSGKDFNLVRKVRFFVQDLEEDLKSLEKIALGLKSKLDNLTGLPGQAMISAQYVRGLRKETLIACLNANSLMSEIETNANLLETTWNLILPSTGSNYTLASKSHKYLGFLIPTCVAFGLGSFALLATFFNIYVELTS